MEKEIFINNKQIQKKLDFIPIAVLMGKSGNGKTTLYNNICDTSNSAGTGKHSVTRILTSHKNAKGNSSFELLDTPGTKSSKEAKKHAWLLKKALTTKELNTIFLFLKYENRFEQILEQYLEQIKPVEKFNNKIVIIITHSDHSEDPNREFNEICDLLQTCQQYICKNIIFYSKKSDNNKMADIMYSFMSNMKKEKLEITQEEFFLKFDFNSIQSEIKMNKAFRNYQDNIKKYDTEMKELVASNYINDLFERDKFLQDANVAYRNQLEAYLEEFQQDHKTIMLDLDSYYLYIELNKNIIEKCDHFFDNFIKLSLSYNPTNPCDPRNLYKRCPHCKLVWHKVTGCNNVTCGTRLDSLDTTNTSLERYIFKKNNDGKLSYVKLKKEPVKKQDIYLLFKDQIEKNINIISSELNSIVEEVTEKFDIFSSSNKDEIVRLLNDYILKDNVLKCVMMIVKNSILVNEGFKTYREYYQLDSKNLERIFDHKNLLSYIRENISKYFKDILLDFLKIMKENYDKEYLKISMVDRIFGKKPKKEIHKIPDYLILRDIKFLGLIEEILKSQRYMFEIWAKKKIRPQGCGQKFEWNIEGLRLKDEEILEIYKVKTIDEVIEILKSKKFNDLNDKYLNQIDDTIYSG